MRHERGIWTLGFLLGALIALGVLIMPGVQDVVAQTPPESTARPDTLRQMILDRVRMPPEPPEEEAADTLPTEVEEGADVVSDPGTAPTPRTPRAIVEAPSQADSLMRALIGLEGYDAAAYEGVRADFGVVDRRLVLWGAEGIPARFAGEGVRLAADSSITYEDRDGRVRTTGATVLTPDDGDPVESRTLIYDLRESRGTAVDAHTTYTEGGRWIVSGNLDSVQPGVLFGSSTRFTSCDLPEPHSYFQAERVKILAGQVLVARSVTMYVEDVPVLWLPFIAQSLGADRNSGLLTPTFSMNEVVRTSSSYNRRLSNMGFYWAMSDYSDMTVALDWFSNHYTALETGIRYRWSRQFLDGSLNLRRYWQAVGTTELGLDTRHNWEFSERTNFRASGRFVSSSEFVREHSFDPREINQTVDSDASLNHRFTWGNLTLGSSRRQYLNEDRTEMTLPSGGLALSTLTLFSAPPTTARWYNNVAVTGSTNWNRRLSDRGPQPDTAFSMNRAAQERTQGSARTSVSLGDLSLSGSVEAVQSLVRDVPVSFFPWSDTQEDFLAGERADFSSGDVNWSTSLAYQQRLIGSTTLNPRVSLQGAMLRVDSIPEAVDFVQGPVRMSAGVSLQTDVYGFYRGFGRFEAIRHKITPNVNWSYSPAVEPTPLQQRVFGGRVARRQNGLSFGFNQTWEARVDSDDDPTAGNGGNGAVTPAAVENGNDVAEPLDEVPQARPQNDGEPRRLPSSEVVTLLALRTSAISYDLVEADSTGRFVDGFTTTNLSNTVSSDYLRGLNLSFAHSLFDDSQRGEGGDRKFRPHLSQLSLGFSLDDQSGPARFLGGLLGGPGVDEPAEVVEALEPEVEVEAEGQPLDPRSGFDQNRMIPGDDDDPDAVATRRQGWEARIQYSLRRPRGGGSVGAAQTAQMIQSSISFAPTANWTLNWATSYDVEAGRFNDHVLRLGRDLHEWEASFGFRQTATGNWSFQFDVSLIANRDLRFDYHQRSF